MTNKERLEAAQIQAASLFREMACCETLMRAIQSVDPGLAAEMRQVNDEWSAATEAFLSEPFGSN